jgi:hypothetical protein
MSDEIKWNEETGEMEPTLVEPIAKALAHFRAMSEPYFDSSTLDDAEHQLRLAIQTYVDAMPNPYVVKLAILFWIQHHEHLEGSASGREFRASLNAAQAQIDGIESRERAKYAHLASPTPEQER